MCSRLAQAGQKHIHVGERVKVYRDGHERTAKWMGFARSETLDKWTVWVPVEIPITGFAEKNHNTGAHTWKWQPTTIRGIVFKDTMQVVTREADSNEVKFFGHHRVPLEVA